MLTYQSNFTDSGLLNLPSPTATYEIADCPLEVCALGEEAKAVKVKIDWVESGNTKTVELSTILAEGGLGQ